jgi:hypothetical protein
LQTEDLEQKLLALANAITTLHAQNIALTNLLIAVIKSVTRTPGDHAYFTTILKAVVEGSYDHALSTNWTDEHIEITRVQVAAIVGPDMAKEIGLA